VPRIERIIADEWKVPIGTTGIADPRRGQDIFSDRAFREWSGSSPRHHTYLHYLSYHALFHAAGEMVDEIPTLARGPYGGWTTWVRERGLTRRDGRWLSDARGLVPLDNQTWNAADFDDRQPREIWQVGISNGDFYRALSEHLSDGWLRVGGYWEVAEDHRRQEVRINSALIRDHAGGALLRALQTAEDFNDYMLPYEGNRDLIRFQSFGMSGWLSRETHSGGIDGNDPYAVGTSWPNLQPGRNIRRLFKLQAQDPDRRSWSAGGHPVITTSQWTDREDPDERFVSKNKGDALSVRTDWLKCALSQMNRNLILTVRIYHVFDYRSEGSSSRYGNEYQKVYLLGKDGALSDIRGTERLW
jgi:hypothetical protein